MGGMTRETTTRTWQRLQRPDSDMRDLVGGMTERRETIKLKSRPVAILSALEHTSSPPPKEEFTTFARSRAPGMAEESGRGPQPWRESRGRSPERPKSQSLHEGPREGLKRGATGEERWGARPAEDHGNSPSADHRHSSALGRRSLESLSDSRDLAGTRSRRRKSSDSSTSETSSYDRGVPGRRGSSDPSSRSESSGARDGGRGYAWDHGAMLQPAPGHQGSQRTTSDGSTMPRGGTTIRERGPPGGRP